jgi:hypothetical protein
MRSVLVFMVSNRGYHGAATANRQGACASRKPVGNKKGRPKPPWFLLTAAVPRDEMPLDRVGFSGKRK